MFAVNKGHEDIVKRLVSVGADVNIKDKVRIAIECIYCMENHVLNMLAIKECRHGEQT